ncbi:hypothetical protein Tco_1335904 [Tanacetum coccineum]
MLRRNIVVVLVIGLLAPLLCGSPGGPPVTRPRVVLRDARHLAYNEYGVSRDVAKYKIVFVHGFSSCRFDESVYHPRTEIPMGNSVEGFWEKGESTKTLGV